MSLRLIDSRCASKLRYRTRKFALTVAAHKAKAIGEPLTAYHCWDCHCYHLGHPVGWRAATGNLVRR